MLPPNVPRCYGVGCREKESCQRQRDYDIPTTVSRFVTMIPRDEDKCKHRIAIETETHQNEKP